MVLSYWVLGIKAEHAPAAGAALKCRGNVGRELQYFPGFSNQKKEQGQNILRKLHKKVEVRNTR